MTWAVRVGRQISSCSVNILKQDRRLLPAWMLGGLRAAPTHLRWFLPHSNQSQRVLLQMRSVIGQDDGSLWSCASLHVLLINLVILVWGRCICIFRSLLIFTKAWTKAMVVEPVVHEALIHSKLFCNTLPLQLARVRILFEVLQQFCLFLLQEERQDAIFQSHRHISRVLGVVWGDLLAVVCFWTRKIENNILL